MTADTTQALPDAERRPSDSERPRKALRLGFNTRVSFNSGPGGARRGLRDGIALFQAAERLGYQSGWAYQRHFDNYLSSPLPFFAAVGQHTERITLGSAVIPMRYQDPILLAEAAGTTDLLVDGRLNLTLSSGRTGFEPVFGHEKVDARTEGQRRLGRFLQAIEGQTLHVVDESDGAMLEQGSELKVTPHSEGLRERIWYGSGHIASAQAAAARRLRLMTGTILHSAEPGLSFSEYQARLIAAYRAAWPGPGQAPPVAVAASVLPATTPELAEKYAAYDHQRRTEGPSASKPEGALTHKTRPADFGGFLVSPVFRGDPDAVAAALAADPGISSADELVLFLPPAFGLEENVRVLADMAKTVAPALGWTPAG
jgi:alkanesulfonate monooxygenase SsuD/methylene tetrahydromethanopterin reductase-like flavin-dependent oxidoreductase (luciferase family)